MKDFETITEYEALNMIWRDLLIRMVREQNLIDENPNAQIAKIRLEKIDRQIKEIETRIIEIEQNK